MNEHPLYPIFLPIGGRPCVIVGGGAVALRKARDLIETGAVLTVVAENPSGGITALSEQGMFVLKTKRFEPDDIDGAFLVFAATDDEDVNAAIAEAARRKRILVNVVDTPALCDFYSGAVVRRGPLRIAISTGGLCPGLAGHIRCELEKLFPERYGDFIEAMGEIRTYIISCADLTAERKNTALSWLVRDETRALFFLSGKEAVWEELKKVISS
ncbi:bifunctional precorrin-2 dehydrogenase/sirohydrochlorin ferrochelatase [bacterium]|nr:bifunctional precorrin-2 dehydrogenase/sirohydrochlorin ferrochelatase [bacterium]